MSFNASQSPERTLRWIVRRHGRQGAVAFINMIRVVAPTQHLADFLGENCQDASDIRRTIEMAISEHIGLGDNQLLSSDLIDKILHPNRLLTMAG